MQGWHNLAGYKRLYILGAGFSRPAGMPLTNELLPLVFKQAAAIKTPDSDPVLGHAEILLRELRFLLPGMRFSSEDLLNGIVPRGFDFERFLTYASVISASQMGTGEQLDEHNNQVV